MMEWLTDLSANLATPLGLTAAMALLAMSVRCLWAVGVPSVAGVACGALAGYLAANMLQAGLSVAWALLAGGLAGFWFGLVLAWGAARLPPAWQGLASLALLGLVLPLARLLPDWTGGREGLALDSTPPALWSFLALALGLLLAARLEGSWFGRAAIALRQDAAVAAGLGIQRPAILGLAYGFAGLLGGWGGVALVLTRGAVAPGMFSTSLGLLALAAALLGGAYHWLGPWLGAMLIVLPSALVLDEGSAIQDFAVALVVLALVIFLPRGLLDPRDSSRRAARARHRQRSAVPAMAPVDDRPRRRRSSGGPHRSRLDAAIKRRGGGPA